MPGTGPTELVTTWYGTFLIEAGTIAKKTLFPQDADAIAERLVRTRAGQLLDEEQVLAKAAENGNLIVQERRLKPLGHHRPRQRPQTTGFDAHTFGYPLPLLRAALLKVAVRESAALFSEDDRLIVQEVKALDEIVKSANLLAERLREWYAIHAPEVVGAIKEHADLARLVAEHGTQQSILAAADGLSASDLGVAPSAADEAIVKGFASGLETLYTTWERIEARLGEAMGDTAPNLATVAGPMLGARLIAAAGGLMDLALAPAGTVQTYGAENALFRHMKDGSPPPKHGIIFQHEAVNRAPWWQRGKISRALAGKISIAAKADAFGAPAGRGDGLKAQFDARCEEIRARYPEPPRRPRRSHDARPGARRDRERPQRAGGRRGGRR